MEAASIQSLWLLLHLTPMLACRFLNSFKRQVHVKRLPRFQYVIAGPGQFMGYSPDGDYSVAFAFLAVVELFDFRVEGQAMVRRFMKCPGQVAVAAFTVVAALFFLVADALAFDTTRIGSEVAYRVKTVDIADLE